MSAPSVTVKNFLSKLESVRADGSGWSARCPCRNDDHNPSLHVGEGNDGRVLVTCHRGDGCDLNEICSAMNIQKTELFPEVEKPVRERLTKIATYDYTDENGNILFQKERYVNQDGKKTFRQRRLDENGGWIYSLGDIPKVLYRLPEVLAAAEKGELVWLVEGEKDANTLIECGEVATTMPGGAGKWLDIHTEALVGADVYIIRDNDIPGIKHALDVEAALTEAGIKVTLCAPPEGYKDVTDYFDDGGDFESITIWTREDIQDDSPALDEDESPGERHLLDDLIEQVETLKTLDLSPSSIAGRIHSLADRIGGGADPTFDEGRLVGWMEFIDEEVDDSYDWLIPGLLEREDRVIIVAAEGVGKTMLARQVAIASAAGINPFTYQKMNPIRTLTIDLENPQRIIRRMSTSIVGASRRLSGGAGPVHAHLLIKPAGMNLLSAPDRVVIEEAIERTKPDLVCLGPLYKSFTDPGTKTSEAVIVEVVKYLDYLRTTYGFALWMEHHAPLGGSGGRELRPFGSAVWSRWPEFGLTLEPDLTATEPYVYRVGNFRGDRDVRHRPTKIKRGKVLPFEVVEFLTS